MFVSKVFSVIFVQTCVLLKESTAQVKKSDRFIGISEDHACDCGIPYYTYGKAGGTTSSAPWRRYPWMVGLVYDDRIVCGGSLIDTQYVLTAAHCLDQLKNIGCRKCELRIALNVRHTANQLVTVGIASHHINPLYYGKNGRYYNDLALIRLSKPVFYTKGIKPICIAVDPKMTKIGTMVNVIGFGRTTPGGNTSELLREVRVPIRDINVCRKKLDSVILDSAICAGGLKNQDSCEGDSGGPMFYTGKHGRSYQVGIVSWGDGCGKEGLPAVYTRINLNVHWIRGKTTDAPSCENMFPPLIGNNIEDCGIPENKCKANGTDCKPGEVIYSWMVRIFYKKKYLGSGVLFDRKYVLTTTQVISPWHKFKRSHIRLIIGMRGIPSGGNEVEYNVRYVLYHFLSKQVPIVIITLNLYRKGQFRPLLMLHRPLCMLEPKQRPERVGKTFALMFWTKGKNHSRSQDMEFRIDMVKIVEPKRCNFSSKMEGRIMCGVTHEKDKCHEHGAILMNYVGGRYYLLGFVTPSTKKCSKVKKFLDVSWNYSWIHETLGNIVNT